MNILLNGQPKKVRDGLKVNELIREMGFADDAIAVAVNLEFVPRMNYAEHPLVEQDEVEIVAPMQGG